MKSIVYILTLGAALILPSQQLETHPFEHFGTYEVSTESTREYFYSGEIHASWTKAAELCELFGMKLLTFDDAKEEENFRKKFASFFADRDSFIFIGANTTQPGSKTEWQWTNGEKIGFSITWADNQPGDGGKKEHCLGLDESDTLYHDLGCDDVYRFVCKESWTMKTMKVKE